MCKEIYADYAAVYDLIYAEKDYEREAAKIATILGEYGVSEGRLLELGCGTGRHALVMAALGFGVTAVDASEPMLERARQRILGLGTDPAGVTLVHGDICSIQLADEFDAALSLFHVMSYMTNDEMLLAALRTCHAHIREEGLLVFDFWYEPAVSKSPPQSRIKRVQGDDMEIVRIAEPHVYSAEGIVDVTYQVFYRSQNRPDWRMFTETHSVRPINEATLKDVLAKSGFTLEALRDWDTDLQADARSWNAYCVARKY